MSSSSNGSTPSEPQQITHPEFRLALLHLLGEVVHSPAIDMLARDVDSVAAAAKVNDLRLALFPEHREE